MGLEWRTQQPLAVATKQSQVSKLGPLGIKSIQKLGVGQKLDD